MAYGWLIEPGGSGELERMVNGLDDALTVIDRTFSTNAPVESCNLKLVRMVPVAALGTPKIFPLAGTNASPFGRAGDPGAKLQV
jgi:hypothetical protein